MKTLLNIVFASITLLANAQTSLVPGEKSFEKKWLKNDTYQMSWFAFKDTIQIDIGEVSTQVLTDEKYLTIVTNVRLKNAQAPWVDTTVASSLTLSPIRHASYNRQRDMVLTFGNVVTGFYQDKLNQQKN